jgi:hypothetical protein
MKERSVNIRKALFLILLFSITVPLLQENFYLIKLAPLQGAIVHSEKTGFSIQDWFSGEYQLKEEKYLNETYGFRELFIRINNQISYYLFDKINAAWIVIGKENYLYEESYINAYYGKDFSGVDSIASRMKKIKYVQDTLAKLNKNLILIFAAGKGSFYPEYFPDSYKSEKKNTNYEINVALANKYKVEFIDFNKYFIENKKEAKYALYPQYGIHWSFYGACLVADSLLNYIETSRTIDVPDIYWTEVEMDDPKEGDYDIGEVTNLLIKLKSYKMAYPKFDYESDSGKVKPSVLVVGDSFYWSIYNLGISNAFSNYHFWYYNRQVFPDSYGSPKLRSQLNLKEEIDKHDVIIIMSTEVNLPRLGWGFVEEAYETYGGK